MDKLYISISISVFVDATLIFRQTLDFVLCPAVFKLLTLKAPRKTASENVACLCCLLNILADFSNLFLHTGKQCEP